ncbi:hypothetical protein Baya_7136 [Bagarius yarrelli]|uniref:Uncharacterized protein n=1 Tax=Bagarius yarrelli TaxID=175774 RepID=A0A556TZC3_BAGYA|nr:hypothetical protein Baya_7136 [Bagarius yarrelli]
MIRLLEGRFFAAPDRTDGAGAEFGTDVRSWMSDTRSRRGSTLLRQERTEAAGIFSRSRHCLDSPAPHRLILASPSHANAKGRAWITGHRPRED